MLWSVAEVCAFLRSPLPAAFALPLPYGLLRSIPRSAFLPGLCRRRFTTHRVIQSGAGDMAPIQRHFQTQEFGGLHHEDYRLFLTNGHKPVSPFHDVPLFVDEKGFPAEEKARRGIYNMVVEIPRWTNAKMEISTKEPLNPIKQDIKKGKARFVCNVFPHKGYIWNYGAFPQTWEDPEHISPETGCKGDADPVDVCEIGHRVAERGEVLQVKVLGVIALIDEGETDWKIIAINIHDPLADKLNDIGDVEQHMPGFLQSTIDWFRCYKMPDGKPANQFGLDEQARGKDLAEKVIAETHEFWRALVYNNNSKNDRGLSCVNTSLKDSPFTISYAESTKILDRLPKYRKTEPLDPSVDIWHFVDRPATNSISH
ncbi:hypothetical protein RvY_18979 [Ramazzottius varieornatus]|uniref:Inorganic pyrophosphatase n=1 Tax=Ramazzottius varieornatus TaxID=947166 RepID=A0A1D1W934_RAMVA|nr:hypothetical protein RvY_18979 [Ramazzottius varieornatus]